MNSSPDPSAVTHQVEEQRFVLTVADTVAVLEYRRDGRTVDFHHTFVPPEARGGGHARRLVEGGINWARAEGLEILASCPYVANYLAAERKTADKGGS